MLNSVLREIVARASVEAKCEMGGYQTCGCEEHVGKQLKKRNPGLSSSKLVEDIEKMSSNGFYRPRSALARALQEKQRNDRHLQEFDQDEWYRVEKIQLSPELKKKFVQLHADEETKEFLSSSIDKSSWVWTQIWYLLAKAVLKHFWSITDINGWLGRGSMFVLSQAQARLMLQAARRSGSGSLAVVDVGAGDGEVSRRFANLYSEKYATEISASMRKALASKGYTLLDTDDWWQTQQFDCVCMLNLLDRCSKPKTMLNQARKALAPGGVLLLALVLPYKPYVEVTADHKPEERLPIQGASFEEQLSSFVSFMDESGFALSSWSRAPYLCEGDFAQAYYWLDDSVYVFTPKDGAT
ncbi:protein-L-histidine N-pros-methyltransferase isoform X2 [Plodia interpunctella]|uniref:protein-L-histidine N-pros-methyltransferase isoform X2 n=1 Tax=Plodia interpunctella TaxID=58824 RepID=UPI0023674CCF|nr:protein-L-histidine N-pros-methyltransferase isoform X2 [Plodia interpunctella]